MHHVHNIICFCSIALFISGCSFGDQPATYAHNFEPNKPPVITSLSSDFSGTPAPGLSMTINGQAYDPNGNPLTFGFYSEQGSFTGQTDSGDGSSSTFIIGDITGGQEVLITFSATDSKSATTRQTYNVGTSSLGPQVSLQGTVNTTIGADGFSQLTFSADSDGFFQVMVLDDSTTLPEIDFDRSFYFNQKNVPEIIYICGPLYSGDNYMEGIPRLKPATESVNRVAVVVMDTMYQQGSVETIFTVTGTTPKPGNSGTLDTKDSDLDAVTVQWIAATDAETTSDNLLYRVYYSTHNNIATVEDMENNGTPAMDWSGSVSEFRVTGLDTAQTYYFNVMVQDSDTVKAAYSPVAATTADGIAPQPGDTGTVTFSAVSDATLSLFWTKATDNVSPREALEYRVYWSASDDISSVADILDLNHGTPVSNWQADIVSLELSWPVNATTAYFSVLVRDQKGNAGIYSMAGPVTHTLDISPGTVSIDNLTNQQLTVTSSWNDGNSFDVTGQVTWGLSGSCNADINTTGLLTATEGGSCELTASTSVHTASISVTINPIWQVVGSAGFSTGTVAYSSLYVYNGIPYVAIGNGSGILEIWKLNTETTLWTDISPSTPPSATYVSLAVVDDGGTVKQHLGFYNATAGIEGLGHWIDNNTATWGTQNNQLNGLNPASYVSLAISDLNAIPYIVNCDGKNALRAMVWDYSDSTNNVIGIDNNGFPTGVIGTSYNSITVRNNSGPQPIVTFRYEDGSNGCHVNKFNGTDWVNMDGSATSTQITADNNVLGTKIQVDSSGVPFVAYQKSDNSIAVYTWVSGSTWNSVGSSPGNSVASSAVYTGFAMDNDIPYVAFWDSDNSNTLNVKYFTTSWATKCAVGAGATMPANANGGSFDLKVYSGVPYVLAVDYNNSSKATVFKCE